MQLSVITAALAAFSAVTMLSGSADISSDKYFECAGKNDNGMVIFREFPKLHFSGQRLKITGSDIFSTYNFQLCDVSNAHISFATDQDQCRAGSASIKSLKSAFGTLNKDSGQLAIAGSQGLHGEYQCTENIKK